MENSSELAKLGATDLSRPLIVGTRVFDKLLTTNQVIDIPRRFYSYLQSRRRGSSAEEAALKCNVPLDEAIRFEATPKAQEYLEDREISAVLAEEAKDPDRFWVRLNAILEGQVPASKSQIEALKLVASRVSPTLSDHGTQTKIEINIDPSAVQEAFRRRDAIESQIIKEEGAA